MNSTRTNPLVAASVVLMLATACSSIDAAPPATEPETAESTTAASVPVVTTGATSNTEIDGGACRLKAISICPLPTTTAIPAP
jgi:hypothetical protein